MKAKHLSVVGRFFLAVMVLILAASAAPAQVPTEIPWGKPVDGLACRLVLEPSFAINQRIAAVVEVKNTSDKKRYLVPQLDPFFRNHLTIEIIDPNGKNLSQGHYSISTHLRAHSYEPLAPGEVKRFDVVDLRDYFGGLSIWRRSPSQKADEVIPGKYTLSCRFRSPKVPPRFVVSWSFDQGKKVTKYEEPSPEQVADQWANGIVSAPVSFQMKPLGKDDFVVHEWGVFTVFNDVKYANVNRKAEWGSLPSFFYRQFPKERLRWQPSAWDKPLIYFYAKPKSLQVSVQVTFAEGAPFVWWPAAASPVNDWPGGMSEKMPRPFRALTWQVWIGEQVHALNSNKALVKVKEFPLPPDCWLQQARLPDAALLTVVGNMEKHPQGRKFPGALDRHETERFLYYDGLVPAPDYIRCEKIADKLVTLRNRGKFDITRLFVVDRRKPGVVGFAFVDGIKQPFKANTTLKIEPRVIAAQDWPDAGTQQVRQALLDAGLFAAEADSLLKIWQKGLLEAEGVTVFHILPVSEYDRMLPLSILPATAVRPVRVGIALHPHVEIEPTRIPQVAALIRQLDDKRFEVRAAASKTLLEIGPLAIAQLRDQLKKGPSLEMRRRIEAILERVDATDWLKLTGAQK